jgi:hypothetical protein
LARLYRDLGRLLGVGGLVLNGDHLVFAGKQRQDTPPGFDAHVAALRDAGFREVDRIWQALANRVVLAVR